MFLKLPSSKALLPLLFCALILQALGCGAGGASSHPPVLTSLQINPASISQAISQSNTVALIGTYSDGSTRTLDQARWSLDSAIAQMEGKNSLVCKSVGSTKLRAKVLMVSTSADVACVQQATATAPSSPNPPGSPSPPASPSPSTPPAVPTGLAVSPDPVSLAVDGSTQLKAVASYSDGTTSDVTSSVAWSTSTLVSKVNAQGFISCSSMGNNQAMASLSGLSAAASVVCAEPNPQLDLNVPGTQTPVGHTLTASVKATYGTTTSDVTTLAQWTVSPAALATVTNGTISCLEAGAITLTATYAGTSASNAYTCAPSNYTLPTQFSDTDDEFVGPFKSWMNIKEMFGAKGDGIADDTLALQTAFDQANLTNSGSRVIFLPAGTYRITNTLTLTHFQYFSIIGADPATTKILWDGPPGLDMLSIDGSSTFKISRLSLDGGGNARSAENINNASNGLYTSKVEISDQYLTGTPIGIDLKHSAETTIERVFFGSNSQYGIFEEDWNDINIFVQDSLFYYCGSGIANGPGGSGSFSARNNFFVHSLVSDMMIQNTGAISARENTSIGSGAFFNALTAGANNAELVLQGNTVLDPAGTPVMLGNTGPLLMIDNVFRTTMPVITAFDNSTLTPSVALLFGNLYSVTSPIGPFAGQVDEFDDSVADASSIMTPTIPDMVHTPPLITRQVFEVAPGSSDVEIQAALDSAAASNSVRPVVHLPVGTYAIAKSLSIPQGSDIQLLGDEIASTILSWVGAPTGAVLKVPSTTKIADLTITNQNWQQLTLEQPLDGIWVNLTDQPATRLLADQLLLQGGNLRSVLSDKVEHATINLSSVYTQGSVTGIAATGGVFRLNKEATLGRVDYVSGSIQSQPSSTSLDVSDYGSLVVQDNWHDSNGTGPLNFNLIGNGRITEQGGSVYTTSATPFKLNNFQGEVTLMGLLVNGGFSVSGATTQTNLLALGLAGTNASFQPTSIQAGTVGSFLNGYYNMGYQQLTPSVQVPDVKWLRRMLGQVRAETTVSAGSNPGSDVMRLKRIQVLNMTNAVHISPKQQASELAFSITNGEEGLSAPSNGCVSVGAKSAQAASWILQPGGEGDFLLAQKGAPGSFAGVTVSRDGGWTIQMGPLTADYSQHWNTQTDPQGFVLFYNRGTGQLLSGNSDNGCVGLSAKAPTSAEEWTVTAQ